jgi:hypothetical protein
MSISWIEQRLAEREALDARERQIFTESPTIHGQLWNELTSQLQEAKKKQHFAKIMFMNGEVLLPVDPRAGQDYSEPRKLKLQLSKDRSAIVAEVTGGNATFSVDAEGQTVFLKFENKKVSIQQAAMLILDKFLFPELKRLDVNFLTAWKGL